MPFDSGSISFRMFRVEKSESTPSEEMLRKFSDLRMERGDFSAVEYDYGWCGGSHIFDARFDFSNNVYNDCITVGLRVDINKVPSAIKKAYLESEVQAAAEGNPSGFASKHQKRQAKESVARMVEENLANGKYLRQKMQPVLWDMQEGMLYASVDKTSADMLVELFERTTKLSVWPMSIDMLDPSGALERSDLERTVFAAYPGDPTRTVEYPWSSSDLRNKHHVNEFLMWLWIMSLKGDIGTRSGQVSIMFVSTVKLACAYGADGTVAVSCTGPGSAAETRKAVESGKVIRSASLAIAWHGQLYHATIDDSLAISGLKLPEVEQADSPRVLFEERITLLRCFRVILDELVEAFVEVRTGPHWAEVAGSWKRRNEQ